MLGPFDRISILSSCESYFSILCVRVLPYLSKKKKTRQNVGGMTF